METCLKNLQRGNQGYLQDLGSGEFPHLWCLNFSAIIPFQTQSSCKQDHQTPPLYFFLFLPSIAIFRDNPGHLPLVNESNSDTGYLFPGGPELEWLGAVWQTEGMHSLVVWASSPPLLWAASFWSVTQIQIGG